MTTTKFSNNKGKGKINTEVKLLERNNINAPKPRLIKGSRTNFRYDNLKQLALKIKRYGELEKREVQIRNTLCIQPNFNTEFAFEILNPLNGVVDTNTLHSALTSTLKIPLVEKNIVKDIVERLAYINENEILLPDMEFFEPAVNDPSYAIYRKITIKNQDENDTSWYKLYAEMWKALINTVKQRRIIQKEMNDIYPDAIDYMFEHHGIPKDKKFTEENIHGFVSEQLKTSIDAELMLCIIQTLDRDKDGRVSYKEF